MRNKMQTTKPTPTPAPIPSTSSTPPEKPAETVRRKTPIPNAVEKANEFKERGNNCVKAAQFQKAIHYYTEAIQLNKTEPVYHTNRALCYLKQSKFKECIDDCTKAIEMDDKAVKAYYRRMQAIEQMQGDLEAALNDCKAILRIDPKNVDAQRSQSRLQALIKPSQKQVIQEIKVEPVPIQPVVWSQLEGKKGYERIDFITKAPHLRSKTPAKRIEILDSESKTPQRTTANSNIQSKDEESKTATTIDQTNEVKKPVTNQKKQQHMDLVIPRNSAQFYRTWKTITDSSQKFFILKGIYNADIGKILGAQFSLDILREMFTILKSQFINQNLPIANILSGIIKNSQMSIITAMMNAEDKLAFTKMVEYMRIRGEDAKQIEAIQKTFDDLISM